MVYYFDGQLTIRDMVWDDAFLITEAEIAQGWHQTVDKYLARLRDQEEGRAVSLAAVWDGTVAGYINVYPKPLSGPFAGSGIPEIVDFGVLESFRRRGIGTRLMDAAEDIASGYADRVCLGVGLHSGYGSAQRMYAKRGYIPDGSGVWYGDKVCEPYTACMNDDDLVLYMVKVFAGRKENG